MPKREARVWVFNQEKSTFSGGVFTTRKLAEAWIAKHRLTGVLTAYPLDTGVYEWAVARGTFRADKPVTRGFIGSFSSAYQEHYHYENGAEAGGESDPERETEVT